MIKLIEFIMRALVLLKSLNSLQKMDKMLGKPRILSFFPILFNKFNKKVLYFMQKFVIKQKNMILIQLLYLLVLLFRELSDF